LLLNARLLIALGAFAAGAAIAAAAVLVFFALDDGGGESTGSEDEATATPTESPTPGPTATPTAFAGATPEAAIEALVVGRLQEQYAGACPERLGPGEQPPAGVCAIELYRSEELATFTLTRGFAGAIGEAVLTRTPEGQWSAIYIEVPPPDVQLAVGGDAVVYLARDCLNFRERPGVMAPAVSCQIDGTRGRIAEGPVDADGRRWWRIEGLGWATDEFLAPVAPPAEPAAPATATPPP